MQKNKITLATEEEIKLKLRELLIWRKSNGKEWSNDFSNLNFWVKETTIGNFWEQEYYVLSHIFENKDLSEVNFKNSDLRCLNFKWTLLNWADLRGNTLWEANQFSKEQQEQIILTDENYIDYQEKKRLEEENKKLKKEVSEKNQTLKVTSDKQTNKLLEWFEELKENFALEEKRWLILSFIAFASLLFVSFIPLFDVLAFKYTYKLLFWWLLWIFTFICFIVVLIWSIDNEVENEDLSFLHFLKLSFKKWWLAYIIWFILLKTLTSFIDKVWEPWERVFKINLQYWLLPIWILLVTFLYFCISQYSKAKKLRIENQNKIAMIHGFQALRAETWDGIGKWRFYDNIANVVFTPVFEDKNSANLPIDKVLDLVKSTIESTTKNSPNTK